MFLQVHQLVVTLVKEQDAGALGANYANMPKILAVLAEVRARGPCARAQHRVLEFLFLLRKGAFGAEVFGFHTP